MNNRVLSLLIVSVLLAACGPDKTAAPTEETGLLLSYSTRTPNIQIVSDTEVVYTVDSIDLALQRPETWEFYATDHGVVLAEHIGSIATDAQLQGLLAYVFVPPLGGFDLPAMDDQNRARAILRQIIGNPQYVGTAAVSEPIGFLWNNHEAAYYLTDSGEGSLTLVLGVYLPELSKLVACSVSAPRDQAERIRAMLPTLLDGLTINEISLDGQALEQLPDPLEFPRHPQADIAPASTDP
jgi:hypothetical protein